MLVSVEIGGGNKRAESVLVSSARAPGAIKRVAIMVPLSNRAELTVDEQISLRHLRHFLGHYDKYAIAPPELDVDLPDFTILRFSARYFGSAQNHKRLLFSPHFYQAFSDYEFLLTYHLDALVFSDQLLEWCDRGFDFIGPPWIKHPNAPYAGMTQIEGRVGNGGFSLKKVGNFLNVLCSPRRAVEPRAYWRQARTQGKGLRTLAKGVFEYTLLHSPRYNNAQWEVARWRKNEELFWDRRARHYYPDFRIATVEEALPFGFEAVPEYCFEINDHKLPFGCHAWPKFGRAFWEPYLLK